MSFLSLTQENFFLRGEFLILSGALFNFLPKKIGNYLASLYFFIIFLCFLFFQIPQNEILCIPLSFSFFLTFTLLSFFNERKTSFISEEQKFQINYTLLIFIYYFLTISVFKKIFSLDFKNFLQNDQFLYSFIYLEFTSILTFILFHLENFKILNQSTLDFRKKLSLRYLIFHLFAGFLFLISMIFFLNNDRSYDEKSFMIFGIIPLLFSLFANSALPFFSFWLTRTYSAFSFIIFLVFANGISKLSIILLLKLYASNVLPTNYQEIIPYIGICSSIFFLLLLIYENNIKKFLCIGILSQNFIFLIFNEKSYENLSEILLHSIFSQSLFFLSIFIITFLGFSKSDFFVDLQLKIRSNKIFFIFLMISSLILIGAPGTPNFLMKNESIQIFKHKSDFNYYLILLYKILNIIVFLFVLPYKVFSLKKENQINRFEYKKSLIMFSFFLGIYIFCFKKDFDFSTQNFELNEFLYQFLISGIIFSFISKILIKNFYSFISSDMIFEKIQLNLMKINFLKYIKIFNKNYNFFVINLKNSSIINFFYKKKDQYYSLESSCIPLLFFGLGLFLIFFFLFI